MLSKIFDMFVQVDQSLDRSQGGLGIGLTLVRSLAQLHGGTVSVHSEGPGHGSEFVVRLPIMSAASPPAQTRQLCLPSARALLGRRILVVDDNVDAAESLAMILRVPGHVVQTAYDGPQALEAADHFGPEVVLLDIGLPRLNGYEVARRLRGRFPRMLLVAVTGYGQEEDRRRAWDAGFDHHLTKPVEPGFLDPLLNRSHH